jgi:hypothetical protein
MSTINIQMRMTTGMALRSDVSEGAWLKIRETSAGEEGGGAVTTAIVYARTSVSP